MQRCASTVRGRYFSDPLARLDFDHVGTDTTAIGGDRVKEAHSFARNHKWYMESRSITMNDEYAFNPDKEVTLDPFIEILERHFKTPKEGLGFDNSPVAHMWRSMAEPRRPL